MSMQEMYIVNTEPMMGYFSDEYSISNIGPTESSLTILHILRQYPEPEITAEERIERSLDLHQDIWQELASR